MSTSKQPRRWLASLPDDDPRFAEMLAYLGATRGAGRYSPTPRMIGEWALLGFLLQSGQLALGAAAPELPALDLAAVRAEVETIARGAGQFSFE